MRLQGALGAEVVQGVAQTVLVVLKSQTETRPELAEEFAMLDREATLDFMIDSRRFVSEDAVWALGPRVLVHDGRVYALLCKFRVPNSAVVLNKGCYEMTNF